MYTVRVRNDGDPVRRAFVVVSEGIPPFATATEGMLDENGEYVISSTNTVQFQVFAHSPVVRLITHFLGIPSAVSETFTLSPLPSNADQTVTISSQNALHFDYMRQLTEIYNNSCRHLEPWDGNEFTLFSSLSRTDNRFIEMIVPDNLPQPLPFVEPRGTITGYPLIHPGGYTSLSRSTLAHELGHALHFQALSEGKRIEGETAYLAHLATHLHDPTHGFTKRTTPFVAFIEAIGALTQCLEEDHDPALPAANRFNPFFTAHASYDPSNLQGDDLEGAVMLALFVDFAQRPGIDLSFVFKTVIDSEAFTFADYAAYMKTKYGADSATYVALKKRLPLGACTLASLDSIRNACSSQAAYRWWMTFLMARHP